MKRYKGLSGNTLIIECYDIIIWWGLICAIAGGSIGYGVSELSHYVERIIQ